MAELDIKPSDFEEFACAAVIDAFFVTYGYFLWLWILAGRWHTSDSFLTLHSFHSSPHSTAEEARETELHFQSVSLWMTFGLVGYMRLSFMVSTT